MSDTSSVPDPAPNSDPPPEQKTPVAGSPAVSTPVAGTPAVSTPAKIQQIGGFEVISKLGQGAMGAVFKARQKSLDRIVALKVLPPSIAKDTNFIERFQREARASAKLNHPNIVQGIDVGKDPATGLWYFAMEYVDGPTVKGLLELQKVLPERRALDLVRDVAKALEAIAANNMVHRDIKPDNILVTLRGETKLADLGLARDTKEDSSLTQSGKAVGTPYYMAPEQVRGEMDKIDIRTDIYALGATMFHLVTGRPPFTGATSAVIMSMHLTEPPPKAKSVNPEVSEATSRLIEKMMQKKPELRFQTPADLIKQIDRVINRDATGEARPVTERVTPLEFKRRQSESLPARKSNSGLLAGVAAVILIGLIVFLMKGKNDTKPVAVVEATKAPAVSHEKPSEKTEVKKPLAKPGGESATKSPAPPAVTEIKVPPPVAPAKTEDAASLFSQAQELEKKSPDAFEEILPQYQKAAQAAKGGNAELEDKIEDALSAAQQRQSAAAAEFWKSTEEKVTAASAEGNYDGALALCQNVPARFATAVREKASARAKEICAEADTKIADAVKRIEEFSTNADPAEGLKVLAEIEAMKYAPAAAALAPLKAKLNAELANVDELKSKRAGVVAEKRLEEVLQRFDAAMLEPGNKAQEIAAEAKRDPALATVQAKVQAMAQVAAATDEVAKLVQQSLEKMKGQKVELETKTGKMSGTIGKIQDGVIFLEIAFGGGAVGTKSVKLADLTEEQRNKFSGSIAGATDAQRVAAAIGKMAKGKEDVAGAIALLAQAPNFELTPHYQEMIMRRQAEATRAAAETAAVPAWSDIYNRAQQAKISEVEAKVLLEKLAKFEQAFGTTHFAEAVKDKVAALKEKLTRAATVNVVKNGDFETGTVQHWDERGNNMKLEVSTTEFHSGRASMHVPVRRTCTPEQIVDTEPGAQYKFRFWFKLEKVARAFRTRTRFYDGRELVLTTPPVDINTPKSDWTLVEATVTAPGKSLRIEIMLRPMPESEGLDAYLDDIEFTRIDTMRMGDTKTK